MNRRLRLAAFLFTLTGCTETGMLTEGNGIRLELQLASVLSGETLDIEPSYLRSDQSTVTLPSQTIALDAGATATVSVRVDVTSCLADQAREGTGPGCPLRIRLTLKSLEGEVLDAVSLGPLNAMPGTTTSPPAVTLRHLETITLSAQSTSLLVGTQVTISALVKDRTNAVVSGVSLNWQSDNPAVATVSSTGVVTPLAAGQVTIRASFPGRSNGPQGTLAFTVASPSSALIGPAGGTVTSADGRLIVTIPPAALANPTTISIQPFVPEGGSDRIVIEGIFQLFPVGLQLQQAATATISYSLAEIPGGARNESTLRMFYAAPGDSTGSIIVSSSVNTQTRRVTGPINQFGIVAAVIATVGVRSLAVGDSHACAALTTGQGLCWGFGDNGELGWGILDSSADGVRVVGTQDFQAMTAGSGHSCGLVSGGQVWCWGKNDFGQLGNGTTNLSPDPRLVSLPVQAVAIEAAYNSTCALDVNQRVWCWGLNGQGQLGVTTTTTCSGAACSRIPVQLPATVLGTTLTAGQHHFCAVSPGFQGCWGSNQGGALGLPAGTAFSTTAVPPPAGLPGSPTALAAGNILTCGLLEGGAAWCWGTNTNGRLGNGSTAAVSNQPPQAVVGGLTFSMIDAGAYATTQSPVCAVTQAGAGYCWGANNRGQLGTTAATVACGSLPCSATPLPVSGSLVFQEIHGGSNFACGLLAGNNALVWCWGGNEWGQLGSGDRADSPTPKRVP